MPELPEVEVVRRGLLTHLKQHQFTELRVHHPRAVRHNLAGAEQLRVTAIGAHVSDVQRRGKFLWLELADSITPDACIVVHLGMSGQMLMQPLGADQSHPSYRHARIQAELDHAAELWFVDQRTFGYWRVDTLVDTPHGRVPESIVHIARDLLDPDLDLARCIAAFKSRSAAIKPLLLDQSIVSGIGNIYADEMLWQAKIHPQTVASSLSTRKLCNLLEAGQAVMQAALAQGGTSFDQLYVNVNGESGYFAVSLQAYGQTAKPCQRCGYSIARKKIAQRSSHYCPKCQRKR
ncbi:bifunctional DNA-formamidopyrimidine glycosylase/DNA-(apurinic or apyrimidinic site) lyase [Corynebacterium sp. HS2168-gen11]|uniref:bifunctional DNA-formamidopyrimidine glycosylase/DNA-(apurinic or apyrimidinic site) lyase n=1 Tax=Corynebacterium sp. HS2168-gen11 TaxID=2974027 RepID=UPI00216B1315|nr:bifunctional DNA-formamidopyrimidine glycosylase/DNA-(apurinic or apyrimidinic site) lyase [Corynebacterium sp. HS2168-gen11]MCS4536262.1 bifunctional DNA-formamidopyrimidine glycosylase/DNA-(apurinic or apyrimidinic site) lyase [Corynebacterium sp. HS2168-gen11]